MIVMHFSTSGSDSENDNFEFKRKKVCSNIFILYLFVYSAIVSLQSRVKRTKRVSSLHARTQPLLPTHLPTLTTHQSQPSQTHRPRLSGQITTRSHVPLPPLTRFSAPPRMQGGERRTALGWKFINKYKGRSNGGIPIFSEERLKERAEKVIGYVIQWTSTFRPYMDRYMQALYGPVHAGPIWTSTFRPYMDQYIQALYGPVHAGPIWTSTCRPYMDQYIQFLY